VARQPQRLSGMPPRTAEQFIGRLPSDRAA
jgi:hypothetical protein